MDWWGTNDAYYGGSISNSYATGSVTGSNYVGGLVGYNSTSEQDADAASISNSYATGSVTGSSYVGGLVGYNDGSISYTYSTGLVSGEDSNYVGGLVGYNNSEGTVNSSFWNTTTSGQWSSAAGTGLDTAGMMTMSNFTDWSIADTGGAGAVWRIYDGYTTPLLTSFLTPLTITADNVSRVYDGSTTTTLTNASYSIGWVNTGNISNLSDAYGLGGRNAGIYNPQLYSNQQGYDISYDGGTLTINQLALTGSISTGSSVYGSTLALGTATFTNVVEGDNLGTATVTVNTAGHTSTSGNLNAGKLH